MKTVDFIVSGQSLKPKDRISGLISGSKNYIQFRFGFDKEWSGHKIAAVFHGVSAGEDEAVAVVNGVCTIPDAAASQKVFKVSLVGAAKNDRITTNQVTVRMEG